MDEPAEPPQSDDQEPTPTPTPTPTPENDDPPAAPTGLTVSRVGHSVLTLTWNDPQDANITGYRILRGTAADSLSTIQADTGSNGTEYEDDTVAAETTYFYAVLALSAAGNGPQSTSLSATTPAAPKKEDPPRSVGPRQAMTTDVWTATLTPAALGGESFGCTFNCSNATVLHRQRLHVRLQGRDYTVTTLVHTISNGNLTLSVDNDFTEAMNALTMVVGTTSFLFSDNASIAARSITWSTSLSWTAERNRRRSQDHFAHGHQHAPAAGAPAITAPNVFRVPAVLGVDLSGITDTDGVTGIAANATYKWQRFNAAGTTLETDSIGTNATYTLTDTDATKTLKVVVNFTDDASNSEGPLTSAATSAITAAGNCAAPTYVGGATQIWTGKLGVKSYGILHGFHHEEEGSSLENPTFTTASSNNYEFTILTNASGTGTIAIQTDTALSATDKRTLVLHICDQGPYEFRLSAFTGTQHTFSNTGQNWSTHAERTVYLSEDTAAPTFASATVNGSTLVVTFNEDLGAAGSLANSAFTVKKGSSGTAQTLSGTPSISGSTVTLTLATAVTATDTAVKVAYTKPTSGSANKLIDKFGNEMVTFPDQAVTNNTTATRVLVSNTGQTGNSDTVISAAEQAQAFTTGATSSTVTSVTIRSEDSEGDDVALKICETTGSSIPTTTCTDLTPPGTYPSGLLVFTAPDMALTPSTTYSVVFSSPDGDGVTLDATDSDNEDGSSLTGWSIRNRSQVKNPTWQDRGH